MNISIKRSPQAKRLTFALLTLVMLGFGALAEQHVRPAAGDILQAQTTHPGQ